MDNKTALVLALMIIALFVVDQAYLGWDIHLFLAREFLRLVDWVAFWR
ncbi:MAG: hypothetical protein K8F59_13595 [Rhodobacteraceae bacterium]|nr:hypothetical protein [Paracoccaceae bacterium]MCB1366441.1 hypothetical protein [Paracoccaceae bacterium]